MSPRVTTFQPTQLARKAADKRPWPKDAIKWSDALLEAPWPDDGPAHLETAFRRAYAARLVELGFALEAKRSGGTGKSGVSKLDGRLVRATPDEFAVADEAWRMAGAKSWNEWMRGLMADASKRR